MRSQDNSNELLEPHTTSYSQEDTKGSIDENLEWKTVQTESILSYKTDSSFKPTCNYLNLLLKSFKLYFWHK